MTVLNLKPTLNSGAKITDYWSIFLKYLNTSKLKLLNSISVFAVVTGLTLKAFKLDASYPLKRANILKLLNHHKSLFLPVLIIFVLYF